MDALHKAKIKEGKERKNTKSKTTKWRITVSRQTEEMVDRQNQGRH